MKTWMLLVASAFIAVATEPPHAMKRIVNGRVYDLNGFASWRSEDDTLRRTAPHLRKPKPQQYWDWEFVRGEVLACTNGFTFAKSQYQPRERAPTQTRFIAVKGYPSPLSVGARLECYAYNLKYSRTDYINGVSSTWLAFDFGTPVK
jgi:hypothetical protein